MADRDGEVLLRRCRGAVFAAGCLAILIVAAWVKPDAAGLGTHEQLGMPACGFYERTGYPCPTCGMTTAFAYVTRGRIIKAVLVQPAGALAALACGAGVVAGGYTVAKGRGPNLLWFWINPVRTIFLVAVVVTTSWLWLCLLTYVRQN